MKKIGIIFTLFISLILVACTDTTVYKIDFEVNGGESIQSIEFNNVYLLEDIDKLNPKKTGHNFNAWYLEEDLNEDSKLDADITSSITLYAKWTVLEYAIVLNLEGGISNPDQVLTFTIFDTVDLLEPSKDGYIFLGWVVAPSDNIFVTKINAGTSDNQAFYAKWVLDAETESYTIQFKNHDGSLLQEVVVEKGEIPVFDGLNPTKASTSTHRYEFIGWDKEIIAANEGTVYVAVFEEIPLTSTTSFDPAALNAIFGFDVYALLPEIESSDYEIIDNSDDMFNEAYIDIFDWSESDLFDYDDLLFDLLDYDDFEDAYILGDLFLYLYADDELIPGVIVYGIAIYEYLDDETPVDPTDPDKTPFDKDELNGIFGFDMYALLPNIISNDTLITDLSDDTFVIVYIDIFTWTEADADAYDALLDANLAYDAYEDAYVVGDYFLYVFYDDETYEGLTVYGVAIYGDRTDQTPVDPTDPDQTPFDKDELNGIFGFDIYALLPNIVSNDTLITDFSDETFFEVYIDIFTWTEADADAYDALLDASLTYDAYEDAYKLGNYFVYVFIDDETYEGLTVFGLGIYGDNDGQTPVDPTDPQTGLYYSFNIQNTTTELPGSYSQSKDVILNFSNNNNKVVIKASHVAHIAGATPGGLPNGNIFAANVSGNATPVVYLEIDALGVSISSMSFEIQTRSNYSQTLLGAKLQVLVGGVWTDLAGGNFYSQLSTNKVTITISNINASKFRLLFQGTGATSNGGQFMISNVSLFQTVEETPGHELWSDVVSDLEAKFDDLDFNTYMPEFEGLSNLKVNKVSNTEYKVVADTTEDTTTLYAVYVALLLNKGYEKDDNLSLIRGHDVYVLVINDDLAYGMYIVVDASKIDIVVFSFDATMDVVVLESLAPRQTINAYEVSKFGMSGLPSTGAFDVLVIPVEIKDVPFELNYLSKLDTVFNGSSIETGWESVTSYYYKSSYGHLDITFDVVPKYITTNNKSFYESKGQDGDQYVILEVLTALDSTIDFSKYDSNNDGVIDSVIFIYSADYDYDVDPWWAWVFSAQFGEAADVGQLDGKDFEYYLWASYTFIEDTIPGYNGLLLNSETYIHELGHLMGMPDFYPYSGSYEFGPLGGFDMMDYNVGDHGPFNKLVFGWLEPLVAQQGTYQVTLDSYSIDTDGLNNTLLIPYNVGDLDDGNAFDEYLLVMFYTPNGLYSAHAGLQTMPSNAGVVVYHIDARLSSNADFWDEYFRNDNEGTSNFLVQILEADKNNSIPGNSAIKQSDLLTSGTLNLSTYSWHQGGSINVSLTIASAFNNNSESVTLNITVA